jgi:hypothetical protein
MGGQATRPVTAERNLIQASAGSILHRKAGTKWGQSGPNTAKNDLTRATYVVEEARAPLLSTAHNPKVGGSNPSPAIEGG